MRIRRYGEVNQRAVFVHGAGGGAWEWAIWERVFTAHRWKVIAKDLFPADGDLARTHLQDYARQVESWMEPDKDDRRQSDATPTVLIGASLGGLLALIAAQRSAPAALVLVNPLPPVGVETRVAEKSYPAVVPWGSARSFTSTLRAMPDSDDAARQFAFRRWRDESGAAMREAVGGVAVGAVLCPILVFASEEDTDVAAAASRALADLHGAEFRLLRGASHVGPLLGRRAAEAAQCALDWCAETIRRV